MDDNETNQPQILKIKISSKIKSHTLLIKNIELINTTIKLLEEVFHTSNLTIISINLTNTQKTKSRFNVKIS